MEQSQGVELIGRRLFPIANDTGNVCKDQELEKPSFLPPAASAPLLFPVSQVTHQQSEAPAPTWLSNSSFSEALLPPGSAGPAYVAEVVEDKPGSTVKDDELNALVSDDEPSERERESRKKRKKQKDKEERRRKKHKNREAKNLAEDITIGALNETQSDRKSSADIWVGESSWQKDYYFDSHGDRDNLAFGSLYRLDVARYHLHRSKEILDEGRTWKRRIDLLNPEADSSAQDESLKAGGRYWSSKVASLERRRDFKRLHIVSGPSKGIDQHLLFGNFIPLEIDENEKDGRERKPGEESWEDYVLRKTRDFNQLTHDRPQNESLWISFAKFQDELIQAAQKKVLMQHAIDKKILLLEKALEFHSDSEDLVLLYLETCKRRDDVPALLSKWERMITKHSASYRLWREYLRLRCCTFSSFSVSALRKLHSQALQALIASRNRQRREDEQKIKREDTFSPELVEAEIAIVSIFVGLCRFEWQTGHHELAIGLFQAQFEYSLLCPPILLSESNKLRLFEAFWNNGSARIGESGAVGWSAWMEQEEEQIQKARVMTSHKDEEDGGWSGWAKSQAVTDVQIEKREERPQDDDSGTLDDVEENDEHMEEEDEAALLERLGLLNLDSAKDMEVKDAHIWKRWSEEEAQRDRAQWLPVKPNSAKLRAASYANDDSEVEDEELERMVLFDDISESLFSLWTEQARLHLIGQFFDFCNAPHFQWCCSNTKGYKERIDSLEATTSEFLASSSEDQNLGALIAPVDWIKESKGRAGFVRNTFLLLRHFFSHNLHFQEVLLSLEAMEACDREDSTDGSSASRALAKKLLKISRQDISLWAAYASFEASAGNVEAARKVFDTALTSLSALPKEAQTDAPIVYLAYAEVEMTQCSDTSEDCHRVLYVLHFLGTGDTYLPASTSYTLSGTQLLKARRGYYDQLQKLRLSCQHGDLSERGASLIICAALFEQLTAGWQAAASIFEDSLAMALPGKRQQNVHFERLLLCYISMLESQKNLVKPLHIRRIVRQGLLQYPFNLRLFSSYMQNSLISDTRRFIDELSQRSPSSILWLFGLTWELPRPGATSRIHSLFERALEDGRSQQCVLLWRCYIAYELNLNNPEGARRVFFRAIHACPWSKALWMDGFEKMSSILSAKELSDLVNIMRDKELRIRTDVYEILLEEAA